MSATAAGVHRRFSSTRNDSITMSAPMPRVDLDGTNQPKLGEKGAEHADHRMRLSLGLPTNCVCRHRNWRTARTTTATPRRSRAVLPCPVGTKRQGAFGYGGQWACPL